MSLKELIEYSQWEAMLEERTAERDKALAQLSALEGERDRLKLALEKIAAGEGYYGAMAREYKAIARTALEGGGKS